MSFFSDMRHTPAASNPPDSATTTTTCPNPQTPLTKLAQIQTRIDSLRKFLSHSVNTNTPLPQPQLDLISSQIGSALHHVILNGTELLSSAKEQPKIDDDFDDYDLIEMDAVELLAEHVHFCEICGKGFKRDANLRMHMRAHGDRFKTPQALAKPAKIWEGAGSIGMRRTRFSCPYVGCNRNKQHGKFRPLKSTICVKNHFKRSHCPKMFSCDRCKKKSFSVVADLKAHLKHCGERKWRCCCGTSFSRKDKLFGHVALFEGHMPAVVIEEEGEEEEEKAAMGGDRGDDDWSDLKDLGMRIDGGLEGNGDGNKSGGLECIGDSNKNGVLEGFFDGCGEMDDCNWFRDGFDSPNSMNEFCGFWN